MKEQLSALIDDELDPEHAQYIISGVMAGGQLKQSWDAYHLIGDVMRADYQRHSSLTQKIMQEISQEPVVFSPISSQNLKAKRSFIPSAWSVAASCAAVMLVAFVAIQQQSLSTTNASMVTASNTNVKSKSAFRSTPVQMASVDVVKNIPSEYLSAHQDLAPNGAHYIQMVAYSGE